jgi:hypothetical protein
MKNHAIFGTLGDNIYYLCFMKLMGGGNLFIKMNYIGQYCAEVLGWTGIGLATPGTITVWQHDFMKPLLEIQDYINSVSMWDHEPIDYSGEEVGRLHRRIPGWTGNQTEDYAIAYNIDILDPEIKQKLLYEPWLKVEPLKIPGKTIIVNRTPRYHSGTNGDGWMRWISKGLHHRFLFVGHPNEHAEFQQRFGIKVDYYPVKDMLEMARLIQGSEYFIGNQSMPLSLAIGLGHNYYCELRGDWQGTRTPHGGYGDVWFPRPNGRYFCNDITNVKLF